MRGAAGHWEWQPAVKLWLNFGKYRLIMKLARHIKVQSRDRVLAHPAPCIRRTVLHIQRLSPRICRVIIPLSVVFVNPAFRACRVGVVYGMEHSVPAFFCALRAGGPGHLVRAGAWGPQKSNIGTLRKNVKRRLSFQKARPAVRVERRPPAEADRPEAVLPGGPCFSIHCGSFPEPPLQTALTFFTVPSGGPKDAASRCLR